VRRYGWRPSLPDHRDETAVLDLVTAPDLISLRPTLPPVYDQGQLGSCVLNSTSCLVQVAERHEGEIRPMPSRLFGYYNCRVEDGSPLAADTGTEVRTAFKVLARYGYCAEVAWPYDIARFAEKPTQACYSEAHKELASRYRTVLQWSRALGSALIQGYPIAMGFSVYESFESTEVAKTGVVPMPATTEAILGGHSMAIIGRDFTRKRFAGRMYELRNSWGKAWGDNGYCWMPAEYIENPRLSSDFWILQAI
jgi:C1A family cysteine protease